MDKESPLHISPFNIVEKMPRLSSKKLPSFLQYGRHTKFGTIFGLSLPDLSSNCSGFCNCVPHHLYANSTDLGAEELATRVLTEDVISEVCQYYFNTKELTVNPKYVKLPCNEEKTSQAYQD